MEKISVDCEAGKYRGIDEEVCQVCNRNSISEAGATICTECPEGTEANGDKTECGKFIISQKL